MRKILVLVIVAAAFSGSRSGVSAEFKGVQIFLGGEFSIRNIHRHDDL